MQVHVLDDGAIRLTQPNGQSFDSLAPALHTTTLRLDADSSDDVAATRLAILVAYVKPGTEYQRDGGPLTPRVTF